MSAIRITRIVVPLVLPICLVAGSAWAAPYGVRTWSQYHDFSSDYDTVETDLFENNSAVNRVHYQDLAAEKEIWREAVWDGTAWVRGSEAYDWVESPHHDRFDFNNADYDEIKDGDWHCAPTSAGMIHDYWWNNIKNEQATISVFAEGMDTNDVNTTKNNGDHTLHYGSYPTDIRQAIRDEQPGAPWSGNYRSDVNWAADRANGMTMAERSGYFGEIRAGRPAMVLVEGHATAGVNFDATKAKINDPDTGAAGEKLWRRDPGNADTQHWVQGYVTQQPERLSDQPAGSGVFFSNDNFGTGQGNAQAPGGDPGDVFGSSLNGSYGRAWEDSVGANDYNGGVVTNGCEYPFDMDALDGFYTIQKMNFLTYSLDDGDPNPHDWIPGVSAGGASYSARELFSIPFIDEEWYTYGYVFDTLLAVQAAEGTLGLNRGEWALPGDPLDDDVDAVDIDYYLSDFAFSVDFVDTRVFPDYEILAPGGSLLQDAAGNEFWYELAGWDPTDIYRDGALFYDGETQIGLSGLTDIDAIQFFCLEGSDVIDGLLFSVDADAPEAKDRWGRALDPLAIYLSWLDGNAPIYVFQGPWTRDLDAITFTELPVPEPATMLLLGTGLVGLVGFRKKFKK